MQLLGGSPLALLATACGKGSGARGPTASDQQSLRATIGAEGGELVGKPGTPFEGVCLPIPSGALAQPTESEITQAKNLNPLPTLRWMRSRIRESTGGLVLDGAAALTLPFDDRN